MRAVLFEGAPEEFARVEAMFRASGDPSLQTRSIVLPQSRPKTWPEIGEEHGYQLADIVLVALSSASVVSEQVRREVEIAQEQHAPIVPVMIEPVAALGGLRWHLIGLQRVDLTTNFDAGMTRLLQELGSIARRAGIDPDANDPEPKQRNGDPVSHTSKVFRHIDESWCPEMLVVPAGRFLMARLKAKPAQSQSRRPQLAAWSMRTATTGRPSMRMAASWG